MKRRSITMQSYLFVFVFILLSCNKDNKTTESPPPVVNADPWKLVFQDDFSGFSVNNAVWSMYDGPGHVGNGLRKPSAFSISPEGYLVVTAQMINGVLVSGGMAHRTNYKYGKFEFRVRTETDPSAATSGVVLTWPQSEKWPEDGELDIYETGPGIERNSFFTVVHYNTDNKQLQFRHSIDATQWHIVAMEWDPNYISIYRDGKLVWTVEDKEAIPDVLHHVCIQLDAAEPAMEGVVKMYVDWIKIYQKRQP